MRQLDRHVTSRMPVMPVRPLVFPALTRQWLCSVSPVPLQSFYHPSVAPVKSGVRALVWVRMGSSVCVCLCLCSELLLNRDLCVCV